MICSKLARSFRINRRGSYCEGIYLETSESAVGFVRKGYRINFKPKNLSYNKSKIRNKMTVNPRPQ